MIFFAAGLNPISGLNEGLSAVGTALFFSAVCFPYPDEHAFVVTKIRNVTLSRWVRMLASTAGFGISSPISSRSHLWSRFHRLLLITRNITNTIISATGVTFCRSLTDSLLLGSSGRNVAPSSSNSSCVGKFSIASARLLFNAAFLPYFEDLTFFRSFFPSALCSRMGRNGTLWMQQRRNVGQC